MRSRNMLCWMTSVAAGLVLLGTACSRSPAKLRVGAPVTVSKAAPIAELAAKPESFAGQTLRIEGTVKAVCQGMGCWVEVMDAKGASFLARSLDESVLLPKDCAGRKIVVEGVMQALPKEMAAEPQPGDHACPRPAYVLATKGVELY